MIRAYLARTKTIVDRYAATPFVVDAQVNLEIRPADQGYLSGLVIFVDGSKLHFAEFLDAAGQTLDKLMYTYHYQDVNDQLIFRYDNARHRLPVRSLEHKHVLGQLMETPAPALESVLAKVAVSNGWV